MLGFPQTDMGFARTPSNQTLAASFYNLPKPKKSCFTQFDITSLQNDNQFMKYPDDQPINEFFKQSMFGFEQRQAQSQIFNQTGSRLMNKSNISQISSPDSTQKQQKLSQIISAKINSQQNKYPSFIKSERHPTQPTIQQTLCTLDEAQKPINGLTIAEYKTPFYDSRGQIKDSVHLNIFYGQNDVLIEELENLKAPYDYLKICSKNGDLISVSTIKQDQAILLLSKSIRPSNYK